MVRPTASASAAQQPGDDISTVTAARDTLEDVKVDSLVAVRKQKYNTRWKQQRNPAIRQDLSFIHILIFYLVLGIIFMSFGSYCLVTKNGVPPPLRVEYTNCTYGSRKTPCFDGLTLKESLSHDCTCQIEIEIDDKLAKASELTFYYELDNFLQNTRSYKKDIDWQQLEGNAISDNKAIKPDCKYQYFLKGSDHKYIYPCGMMANSYFSDTFIMEDASGIKIKWSEKDIARKSDKPHLKNPKIDESNGETIEAYFDLPKDWHDGLRYSFVHENGVENEHFAVWIRAAAFSRFRKKYARINQRITKGKYIITIQYRYEVNSFHGRKFIVIQGDNEDKPIDNFFHFAFFGVGTACLALGPIFFLIQVIFKAHMRRRTLRQSARLKKDLPQFPPEEGIPQSSQNVTEGPSLSNTAVVEA